MHNNDTEFYSWLAGLVDGDGCVCISPTLNKGKYLRINFSVTIGMKELYASTMEYIHSRSDKGKIYYSNKGTENGICRWQTTNMNDAIYIAEKIVDYSITKKHKIEKFLECVAWYNKKIKPIKGRREKGSKLHVNTEIKELIKVALELNYDRQTIRYRNKKGLDYWYGVVDRLYSVELNVQSKT